MRKIVFKDLESVFSCNEEKWIITASNGRSAAFVDQKDPFLPLLEKSFSEFDKAFNDESGGRSSLVVFPYVDLLRFGIQSESEYWQGLALERMGECGKIDMLIEELQRVKASGLSQKNRHLAAKILNKKTGEVS